MPVRDKVEEVRGFNTHVFLYSLAKSSKFEWVVVRPTTLEATTVVETVITVPRFKCHLKAVEELPIFELLPMVWQTVLL
jgi:hypothetical protein